MKFIVIGDCVRPGVYRVVARFEHSVLLQDGAGRAVFVVDRSIGPGPLNIVVDNPHRFADQEELVLRRPLRGRRYDSTMPPLTRSRLRRLLTLLERELPRAAPPESLNTLWNPLETLPALTHARDQRIRRALGHAQAGRLAAAVKLLRGCGTGLTPSGDDFLCGWMLACRLLRQATRCRIIGRAARGKNFVTNAFLEMAEQGRVNAPLKRLLLAPTAQRIRKVCRFGHTSGADLLCGLRWGLSSAARIKRAPAATKRQGSAPPDTSQTLPMCAGK